MGNNLEKTAMEIKIENVSKKYGTIKAVDNVSLNFIEGINILMGNDGAGKSTLIKLLVGNLHGDSGNIFFNGKKIDWRNKDFFQVLGYLPSNFRAYENFTVIKMLKYFAALKGISPAFTFEEILNLTELNSFADTKIKHLPRSLLIRFGIAQSILNDPKVLIMDEPMRRLDIYERMLTSDIILRVLKNRTLIIANQLACDFKNLSANYIFMKNGKIILQGLEFDLIHRYEEGELSQEQASEFKNLYLRTIGIYVKPKIDKNSNEDAFLFKIGNFRFDKKSYMAFYNEDKIDLTPIEFLIFLNLAENIGNTLNAETLFTSSSNAQYYKGADRVISVHIAHIRKKLSKIEENLGDVIKNIRNSGYIFNFNSDEY